MRPCRREESLQKTEVVPWLSEVSDSRDSVLWEVGARCGLCEQTVTLHSRFHEDVCLRFIQIQRACGSWGCSLSFVVISAGRRKSVCFEVGVWSLDLLQCLTLTLSFIIFSTKGTFIACFCSVLRTFIWFCDSNEASVTNDAVSGTAGDPRPRTHKQQTRVALFLSPTSRSWCIRFLFVEKGFAWSALSHEDELGLRFGLNKTSYGWTFIVRRVHYGTSSFHRKFEKIKNYIFHTLHALLPAAIAEGVTSFWHQS